MYVCLVIWNADANTNHACRHFIPLACGRRDIVGTMASVRTSVCLIPFMPRLPNGTGAYSVSHVCPYVPIWFSSYNQVSHGCCYFCFPSWNLFIFGPCRTSSWLKSFGQCSAGVTSEPRPSSWRLYPFPLLITGHIFLYEQSAVITMFTYHRVC